MTVPQPQNACPGGNATDGSMSTPLTDDPEFAAMVAEAVRESAPRIFAVVEVADDDGWIAGWGAVFPDHVALLAADGRPRTSCRSVESVIRLCSRGGRRQVRIVWQDELGAETDAGSGRQAG